MWTKSIDEVESALESNLQQGLTSEQVNHNLTKYGVNLLPQVPQKPWWRILCAKFIEPFVIVLLACAVITFIMNKWSEGIVIILIVVLDAILSSYQEIKANKSLEGLKKLLSPQAIVIRNGIKQKIDASQIVKGDVVVLETGSFVPADLRIIEDFNLKTNESSLTGESSLVLKTTNVLDNDKLGIADRINLAYMSTTVVIGSGKGVVYATGKDTEIGKISTSLNKEKEILSPLRRQMKILITLVSLVACILALIMFCIQYFISFMQDPEKVWEALTFSIALLIAVIPEGLSVIITVSLSLGGARLAKKNAIIKQLRAVETLGQVNTICTDKTGTLTQNKMTVTQYYDGINMVDTLNQNSTQAVPELFVKSLVLCNDSFYDKEVIVGDPTETALFAFGEKFGFNVRNIRDNSPRLNYYPFDSQRKTMSTINYDKDNNERYAFIKGAADKIVDKCTHIFISNEIIEIQEHHRKSIFEVIQEMSNNALRVLAGAYKLIPQSQGNSMSLEDVEDNLTFLGLVGMVDPTRQEVKVAIANCKRAGITTVMITGDHPNTAFAIGKELGIANNKSQIISGMEIDAMDKETFKKNIEEYKVFARVSPNHKVEIVKALQSHDKVVSMTGDGVNDAASLRAANIGVAMGIQGTDVAKEASQMILNDDNFLTIPAAIEEGRNIYNKIKRIICFILITNLAQAVAIIIAGALGLGDILQPLQILWINLIVESLIAVPMSMSPNDPKVMLEKPIRQRESVLKGIWVFILVMSVLLSVLLIITYLYLPQAFDPSISKGEAPTYTFIVMVNAPLFYALFFAVGSHNLLFSKKLLQNRPVLIAVILAFIFNAMIVFVPGMNGVFEIKPPSISAWFICLGIAIVPTIIFEITKLSWLYFNNKKQKKEINLG